MKYRSLFIMIFLAGCLLYADIDSLKNALKTQTGKVRYQTGIDLADELNSSDDSAASNLVDEAIKYAEENNELPLLMKARFVKGDIFLYKNEFRKSGMEYKNSLVVAEKLNDEKYLLENFRKLGTVAYYLSDLKTAMIFMIKSLEMVQGVDEQLEADILNDLGTVYDKMGDRTKALEYYDKALEIYQKHSKMLDIAKVLNNKAIVFSTQKKHQDAYNALSRVLKIFSTDKENKNIPFVKTNMAVSLIDLGRTSEATRLLVESEKTFKSKDDKLGYALNQHVFGKVYFKKKQYKTANNYFQRSLKTAKELELKELERDNYLFLAMNDSIRGRYKSSLKNHHLFVKLNDEIQDQEQQREISELMAKFEIAKKEKQNFSLIRDNEIKKLEIEKQKQINNFFIVLFVMLAGLIYLIYRSFVLKSKNEDLLTNYSREIENLNLKLQDEIEKVKLELNETNVKLMNSEKEAARIDKLVSLGTMVAGITHEIKNPTQVIKLSMDNLRLSLNDLAIFIYELIKLNKSSKRTKKDIKSLVEKHRITKLFNDLKNLVISNKKSVELIDQIVTSTTKISRYTRDTTDNFINEIINDVMTIMKNSIKYSAKIELDLDNKLPSIKCNYQEIAQILINLLTNAKDAISEKDLQSDEGLIKIRSFRDEKNIFIEVKDNGVGIPKENESKIFDAFFTSKPTGSGQGLGLRIVKNIVEIYKGDIEIDSIPGEGTTFKINFPLKIVKADIEPAEEIKEEK